MPSARRRPVQSMTGYAHVQKETPAGQLDVELRSVNSRFLDLVLRMPDELRGIEPALRELLGAHVQRGKLECRVNLRAGTRASALSDERSVHIDGQALARFIALAREVARAMPDAAAPSVIDALRWPGVVLEESGQAGLDEDALAAAGEALARFNADRAREGARLVAFVLERIDAIEAIVTPLAARTPELLAAWQQRLVERLRDALTPSGTPIPLDESMARVRQEVAAHGLRIDIAEEISRLQTHLAEMRHIIGGSGPVGKRLDFLLQELNREANTLGSKAAAIDLGQASIELKVLIEQIREQVQNLE